MGGRSPISEVFVNAGGEEGAEPGRGEGCAADQTRADNEEVNKRNGTWKCSPNMPGPTI